mgnify:CR=1 FL=1
MGVGLPLFAQAADPTTGLGTGDIGMRPVPRQVSETGMDLNNSKAESTQYLRGQRKDKGGLKAEEHCHLEGGEWSAEMVMSELNFEDCVGPGHGT